MLGFREYFISIFIGVVVFFANFLIIDVSKIGIIVNIILSIIITLIVLKIFDLKYKNEIKMKAKEQIIYEKELEELKKEEN